MFVIFGWEKTVKPLESLLKTHCNHCDRDTQWSIWQEREWVSLFFVKVLPFINKHHLGCDICGDSTTLAKATAKAALDPSQRDTELHDQLVAAIESHQFAGFTERQINYRRSAREHRK